MDFVSIFSRGVSNFATMYHLYIVPEYRILFGGGNIGMAYLMSKIHAIKSNFFSILVKLKAKKRKF